MSRKKEQTAPKVAILIGTNRGWGWQIINGIIAYAREHGPWNLWVKPESLGIFEEIPPDWEGDGIIARITTSNLTAQLKDSGIPVVNVADNPPTEYSGPSVLTDDHEGTRLAAEFFFKCGLRTTAFVGPTYRTTPAHYLKAFQQALPEYHLPCHVFHMQEKTEDFTTTLIPWLENLPKPVGLLACGTSIGRIVTECCNQAGLNIPHDVAILSSTYDPLLNHTCFPPLSGVQFPGEQIGYAAARQLHAAMQGQPVPEKPTYILPSGISEELSTDTQAIADPLMNRVIAFLKKNAFKPLTINEILKEVPMARRSLERRFCQTFGCTISAEIKRIRIERARNLLANSDMQMQEIAESCGYANYNYLSYTFKQSTGISPREYRKQSRLF